MTVACIQRHDMAHYNCIFYSNIVEILHFHSDMNNCSEKSLKITPLKFALM